MTTVTLTEIDSDVLKDTQGNSAEIYQNIKDHLNGFGIGDTVGKLKCQQGDATVSFTFDDSTEISTLIAGAMAVAANENRVVHRWRETSFEPVGMLSPLPRFCAEKIAEAKAMYEAYTR